ncbi:hypothetical protein [Streptomyces botrytidirepellens]|uniref:Uncharacterized protein n=1 Tax=Streptomyces botrytidirepellens TaxID=2486417 RepID=A0A3M8V9S7_9ACTN|nr:hypothetical protein [Streptomyces botrytidirepellens]RNG14314.1 hypothetical protein EEJ42_31480 [Streptomyces botrytidirepellens]
MNQLTYPRPAAAIAARARMALGAYRAVPGHEAAHELERWLQDMWYYGYFALHNDSDTARWTVISQELIDAQQLLKIKTTEPAAIALAAHAAISRFEHATGTTPGAGWEALYTRAEAERAAYAAFDSLHPHLPLDHRSDREFVAQAFLAFLDNPDSPYPYTSHNPDEDEEEDDQGPTC